MEENLKSHQAPLEQQMSAQEGILHGHLDSSPSCDLPGSSDSWTFVVLPKGLHMSACTRILGSFLHGHHSFCVRCRELRNPDKCAECSNWSCDKVFAAFKYQCSLSCRRDAKAKQKSRLPASPSVTHSHSIVSPVA